MSKKIFKKKVHLVVSVLYIFLNFIRLCNILLSVSDLVTFDFYIKSDILIFLFFETFLFLMSKLFINSINASTTAISTDLYQFLPYLPAEDARVLPFEILDPRLDFRRSYSRFAAADHAGSDRSRFLIPVQDFRYTSVRYPQLSRYDARPDTGRCHLYDLQTNMIR